MPCSIHRNFLQDAVREGQIGLHALEFGILFLYVSPILVPSSTSFKKPTTWRHRGGILGCWCQYRGDRLGWQTLAKVFSRSGVPRLARATRLQRVELRVRYFVELRHVEVINSFGGKAEHVQRNHIRKFVLLHCEVVFWVE